MSLGVQVSLAVFFIFFHEHIVIELWGKNSMPIICYSPRILSLFQFNCFFPLLYVHSNFRDQKQLQPRTYPTQGCRYTHVDSGVCVPTPFGQGTATDQNRIRIRVLTFRFIKMCAYSSKAEQQFPKLKMKVRFFLCTNTKSRQKQEKKQKRTRFNTSILSRGHVAQWQSARPIILMLQVQVLLCP